MKGSTEAVAETDWVEVATIGDLLVRAASRWPSKEALVFPELRRTYAELLAGAVRAARAWYGLGARAGDRVGILMPNCLDFVELEFGAELLGLSVVPINARYKSYELRHV